MTALSRKSTREFRRQRRLRELPLHLMLLPGLALILVFHYVPMFGIVMAFQNFKPAKGFFGSKWVGMENFIYMAKLPNMSSVLFNTVFIAVMKIIVGMVVPIFVALMLNEIGSKKFKRTVQTVVYFPHFLSWVILGGVLMDVLSPSSGIVNDIIRLFGGTPIYFLGDKNWFPYTMVITAVWKNFGYQCGPQPVRGRRHGRRYPGKTDVACDAARHSAHRDADGRTELRQHPERGL